MTRSRSTGLAARKRVALLGGLGALALFMAVPVLMVCMHRFDGKAGPVRAGFLASAFAIAFPLAGAHLYARWVNRFEDRS